MYTFSLGYRLPTWLLEFESVRIRASYIGQPPGDPSRHVHIATSERGESRESHALTDVDRCRQEPTGVAIRRE